MMVANRGTVFGLLRWQWKKVLVFTVSALVIALLHTFGLLGGFTLPVTPVVIVGGALGIFVSFRTNSAYDRWWEGRKLWGRMVNASRHFVDQVTSYVTKGPEARERAKVLVHRHIAYVHTLRVLLRQQDLFEDKQVAAALGPEELDGLRAETNPTHALLHRQSLEIAKLADEGYLDERRLQSIDNTMHELLNIQGGCERIKKTPLPRGYGFIAERLILAFGVLFPFALVGKLGFLIVPVNVLVTLAFALISEAGRVLEDPFNMFWNGLPLGQLSTMIEANLRQRIDEDPPDLITPDERGILM